MTRYLPALALLTIGLTAHAEEALRYSFAGELPYIVDLSGHLHHGLVRDAERVVDEATPACASARTGMCGCPRRSCCWAHGR